MVLHFIKNVKICKNHFLNLTRLKGKSSGQIRKLVNEKDLFHTHSHHFND